MWTIPRPLRVINRPRPQLGGSEEASRFPPTQPFILCVCASANLCTCRQAPQKGNALRFPFPNTFWLLYYCEIFPSATFLCVLRTSMIEAPRKAADGKDYSFHPPIQGVFFKCCANRAHSNLGENSLWIPWSCLVVCTPKNEANSQRVTRKWCHFCSWNT